MSQNVKKNSKTKKELLTKKNKAPTPPVEYDSDSSDEEVLVRTGDVPTEWYDGYQHIGYDINSKKVQKPNKEDEIEKFLKQANDKNWWRNLYDEKNNKTVFLSDKDLNLINRIRKGLFASKSAYKDDYFEKDIPYQVHPLSNHIPSKKSFGLSKNERKTINRLIYLYKNGLMSMEPPKQEEDHRYDLWEFENENSLTVYHPTLGYQPPKRELPETTESYNPPNSEVEAVLRKIPRYDNLLEEELERCCDLFLSARTIKKKIDIDEKDILPDLPKPEELRPFPTKETILYKGHESSIRAVICDPNNTNILISGDNGNFVHFWDIDTAKIITRMDIKEKIRNISFNSYMNLVVICSVSHVFFVMPKYLDKAQKEKLMDIVKNKIYPLITENSEKEIDLSDKTRTVNDAFIWKIPKQKSKKEKDGVLFYMKWKQGTVKSITWHNKGDYFSSLSKNAQGKSQVFIHSLTKMTHQLPISHIKGNANTMLFHPSKPYFIVATNTNIFIYNLQKQEMVRKFVSNLGTITHVAIHKNGSDLIAGAKDGKVAWFQLELSDKPFKLMDYHQDKIKSIGYHQDFPLFFSCSRNGKLLVYYGKVTEEELTDPLIVPLKILRASNTKNVNYTCSCFHPKQPWIFSGGEDGIIRLWS